MLFWQKHHAHTVFAGRRQSDVLLGHLFTVERVRQLNQNACAIAHQFVGAYRAAMVEIFKNLQALLHDGMRLVTFDVCHKTHAASIVLMGR